MKPIILAAIAAITLIPRAGAQGETQIPDWVGRSNAPTPHWATYIGDGFFVTVAHWAPKVGQSVIFQNGESATVAGGWRPRGGPYHPEKQADVFIGWLDSEPSLEPAEIWWEAPPELLFGGWIEVEGIGLAPDWETLVNFSAQGHWRTPEPDADWLEWGTGIWFYCPTGDEIRPGDSGSPVFYDGKLLGCIGAGGWDLPIDHSLIADPTPPNCFEVETVTMGILNPWFWVAEQWPRRMVFGELPTVEPVQDGVMVSWISPLDWILESSSDLTSWQEEPYQRNGPECSNTFPLSPESRFYRLRLP